MRRKWVTKRGEICWAILAVETFTKFLILVDSNDARIIVILKDLHAYLLNSILLLTYIFLRKVRKSLKHWSEHMNNNYKQDIECHRRDECT